MRVQVRYTHTHTHMQADFCPSSQPGSVLWRYCRRPNAPNAHQPYRRGSTQIAMCISQAKQVNYFPSLFSFIFTLLLRSWPCGMDVMRWSTQTAIYPPFVPLRSFKKANSLKADRVRERERGRES